MAWKSTHENWVDWRLNHPTHPSLCHVCPYNGQRKVGADGPFDSTLGMYLFESPGKEEEKHNRQTEQYGRPVVGPSGYMAKTKYFPPEAVDIAPGRNPKWPVVRKLKVFIANVIMCYPGKMGIDTKDGKKAVKCCSPSAKALVEYWQQQNPKAGLQTVGAVSTSVVTGKPVGINDYRGRVFEVRPMQYEPEIDIYKYVLRGVKPPDWWKANEKVLRQILGWNRRSWKKATAPPKPVKEKKSGNRTKRATKVAVSTPTDM